MWHQLVGVPIVSLLSALLIGHFWGERLGVSKRQTILVAIGTGIGMFIGSATILLVFG